MTQQPAIIPLKPLSLRTNFLWTFAGNSIAAVCQAVVLLVLLNTTTLEATGEYSTALGWCAPLFMFAGLDIRVLLATDSRSEYRFSEYLAVRLLLTVVALACVPMIALATGRGGDGVLIFLGVGVNRLLELVSDAFYGLMQRAERMDRVSRSMVIHGLVATAIVAGAVWISGNLVAGLLLAAVAKVVVLLLYDVPLATRLAEQVEGPNQDSLRNVLTAQPRRLWRLASQGMALAVRKLFVSLNANVTKLFVDGMCGTALAGVFAPFAAGVNASTTVSRALNQAVASRLGRLAANNDMAGLRRLINKLQLLYLGMGAAGIAVAWLLGHAVLSLLLPADVAQFSPLLIIVIAAVAVQYQGGILDMALVALRRVNVLVPVSGATLLTTVIGCWLLIPEFSLAGVTLAMLASRVVRVAILTAVIRRELLTRSAGFESAADDFAAAA
ncbi:oligosaccharide flippase family protein [bacterium]|nr:oligosaccharide flippase family protein [bacterium]